MGGIPRIRDLPVNLEHLVLGGDCVNASGASAARLVWFCLWTHRRSASLEVFPGDPRQAEQACIGVRQVQAGLRCLERIGRIERGKRRRGRTSSPKRVIQLQPRVEPSGSCWLTLPPLAPLQTVCERDRSHVDVAVMLGLYVIALEYRLLHPADAYSRPFVVTWACVADLLGLGRNTPRRCIDRLAKLDLVRPVGEAHDWSSGLRVAHPSRWFPLANQRRQR